MTSNRPRSASHRTPSDRDGAGVSPLGSLAAVAASVATSALGALVLPARVRVHWSLGPGPYYGPETAPTLAVFALFPALVAGVALGARWLEGRLPADGVAAVRPYYALAVWATLAVLLGTQALLVVANL